MARAIFTSRFSPARTVQHALSLFAAFVICLAAAAFVHFFMRDDLEPRAAIAGVAGVVGCVLSAVGIVIVLLRLRRRAKPACVLDDVGYRGVDRVRADWRELTELHLTTRPGKRVQRGSAPLLVVYVRPADAAPGTPASGSSITVQRFITDLDYKALVHAFVSEAKKRGIPVTASPGIRLY